MLVVGSSIMVYRDTALRRADTMRKRSPPSTSSTRGIIFLR